MVSRGVAQNPVTMECGTIFNRVEVRNIVNNRWPSFGAIKFDFKAAFKSVTIKESFRRFMGFRLEEDGPDTAYARLGGSYPAFTGAGWRQSPLEYSLLTE